MSTISQPESQASHDLFWDSDQPQNASSSTSLAEAQAHDEPARPAMFAAKADTPSSPPHATISLFETIFTTYPPILESLLDQIPTSTLLTLYHTSTCLRDFLQQYPLAWKTLSFRLPQPAATAGTPGNETPDGRDRVSKQYYFDALLKQVICYGSRLTSLDLCNTAVSGTALVISVLSPRIGSLKHLSVRGCKNVSIKYHIVPFLEPYTLTDAPWPAGELALKSLYTYRCRHHRRRPYLPSSLLRRDSDSDPTHQLIEICHQLGIWTDTAWCPTPGGRCNRRKEYHAGRAGPLNMEVWVPFDKLWRSQNRLGPAGNGEKVGATDGRLWEISETGQEGEPLGPGDSHQFKGEGKHVPTHLRKSHTIFIEELKCAQCDDVILERCESCSVRMHCMGCRKTLCASCAFNRPIPRKRVKTRHFASLAFGPGSVWGNIGNNLGLAADQNPTPKQPTDTFWWAPGATRSPNLMNENAHDDDSSDSEDGDIHNGLPVPPANREPPKLKMHWCCLEPSFSGGGGIAISGTGLGGRGADKIRAAPLPRTKEFEDPDFSNQLRPVDYIRESKNNGLYEYVLGEDVDLLSYLKQDSLEIQANTCPRSLCNDCHRSFRWKVSCRACKNPLCKEHDFRGLKFRKCGYRDMHTEREYARTHQETPRLIIPEFKAKSSKDTGEASAASSMILPSESSGEAPEDSTLMSQSQILVPPFAVDMSGSAISSQQSTSDLIITSSSVPFVPISSSRPRSFSASGVRSRNSGTWSSSTRGQVNSITNPLPLPCNPRHPVQWEGCGAYFCQQMTQGNNNPRGPSDTRPPCPANLKECSDCAVLVCESCVVNNPTCTCSFCTLNFHCPHCSRKPSNLSQCRLEEETRAREEAERLHQLKIEIEKNNREKADNLAGAAYEFWSLVGEVEVDALVADDADVVQGDGNGELSLPSPDSITVTMEFGVSEEPSNITTITAAGPAASPAVAASTAIDADAFEIQTEDLADDEGDGEDAELDELDAILEDLAYGL